MKRNVYFVQVSSVICDKTDCVYLPYSVSCIAAYAWNNTKFSELYRFGRFVFLREDIETSVASLEHPFAVAFSCYIWNTEYNKAYAKRLREVWPDVKIIFGGHNMSPDGKFLEDNPYIDVIVHGEGEETFTELMLAYDGNSDLSGILGISYRREDGTVITTDRRKLCDVTDYPSPYLAGYFDDIVKDKKYKYSIVWETNRGCPNSCAFCDWGTIHSKVRFFPMERLRKEIEWMAENKIEYIYGADANFGMFKRDNEIADLLIDSKERTGYPCKFKMNYSIIKNKSVFEIGKKLYEHGISKFMTLSFQSMSSDVSANINRRNMRLDHFCDLIEQHNEAGLPAYSELILGLPGETYESFTDGIDTLISCNQHTNVAVYPCVLLPNSQLGSEEFIRKYGIETKSKLNLHHHCVAPENDIPEYSDIIFATSTLSIDDWLRTYLFAKCISIFHNCGLLRVPAIYAHIEKGMSYKAFYESFIDWSLSMTSDTLIGSVFSELDDYVSSLRSSDEPFYRTYEGMGNILWEFEDYAYTKIVIKKERFYREVAGFLSQIEEDAEKLYDLIEYQKALIKKPGEPVTETDLRYDFHSFFRSAVVGRASQLKKKPVHLRFTDMNPTDTIEDFMRYNIWYGRTEDAQLFTGINSRVEYLPSKYSAEKITDRSHAADYGLRGSTA